MPGSAVRIPRAGAAKARSTATVGTAYRAGFAATAPASRPQAERSVPRRALRRLVKGSRQASTRSPRMPRTAGSTVAEASTATPTTSRAPIAIEVNMPPATSIPAIATMTVSPEMTTARPAVPPAIAMDSSTEAPAARSSRARRTTKRA